MVGTGSVRVAVTGASGFIGRGLLPALGASGADVAALSRQPAPDPLPASVSWHQIPAYDDPAALEAAGPVDCLIHLADNPDRTAPRSAEAGEKIARTLGAAMARSGTRRLVLASSVYARLAPDPGGYGYGKRLVERALLEAEDISTVILRLPPVYGPGARGGFAALAHLVRRGLPLPFRTAREPRAYLSRENLAALFVSMIGADDAAWMRAAGQVFEPSDGTQITTADLIRAMAGAMGRPARLLPVPKGALRALGRMTGKADMIAGALDRLDVTGNSGLEDIFGWTPRERMPGSLGFLAG